MAEELKKNDVHIKAVKNIQAQIEEVISLARRPKTKAKSLKDGIVQIRTVVSATFNNREMALVNTKLQEAEHWTGEDDKDQVIARLVEAKNWAGEYIIVLE